MKHDASKRCYAIPRCNICKKSHNTLMHREQKVQPQKETDKASSHIGTVAQERKTIVLSNHVGRNQMDVLLATAIVKVKTMTGSQEMLRVLVDPGSQASFITEEAAQVLALPKQKIRAEITGLGKAEPKVSKAKIEVEIKPRFPSNFKLTTELMVLATLTQTLPREELKDVNQKQWQNRLLADLTFNKPGPKTYCWEQKYMEKYCYKVWKKPKTTCWARIPNWDGCCREASRSKTRVM